MYRFIIIILLIGLAQTQFPDFRLQIEDYYYDCGDFQYCIHLDNKIYWGEVFQPGCPDTVLPSGIQYEPPPSTSGGSEITLGQVFSLGQISSRNVVIYSNPGFPDQIMLYLNISIYQGDQPSTGFVNQQIDNFTIEILLEVMETLNAEPCVYEFNPEPPGDVPCPDLHRYTIPFNDMNSATFQYDNRTYQIDFLHPGFRDIIIPEMCRPEEVTPSGFQGPPEDLPAVIFCSPESCCPFQLTCADRAWMYFNWTVTAQRFPTSNNVDPVRGQIQIRNLDVDFPGFVPPAGLGGTILNGILIDDYEEHLYMWPPHGVIPGNYSVIFVPDEDPDNPNQDYYIPYDSCQLCQVEIKNPFLTPYGEVDPEYYD